MKNVVAVAVEDVVEDVVVSSQDSSQDVVVYMFLFDFVAFSDRRKAKKTKQI